MNGLLPQRLEHTLVLADGSRWAIAAGDEEAASIVSQLGDAMQLRRRAGVVEPPRNGIVRRLLVRVDAHDSKASRATRNTPSSFEGDGVVVSVLRPFPDDDGLFVQLVELSLLLARDAEARGGVLLHGALAEKDGVGVVLAAPGATGKTTASGRLPAPWRSLCDDATLVVPDSEGNYRGHPWPTWSRFLWGGSGGTWDVQNAVPLKGVFFLSRAASDRVESVGPGRAASLLVESAEQASQLMSRGLGKEDARALHLGRFHNICALARVVPAHVLHISLTGAFWGEIDRVLQGKLREGRG